MKPQPHSSRWTPEEESFLRQSMDNQQSLGVVCKTISLRTEEAILKKAHELGYGRKYNKDARKTYFYRGAKKKRIRAQEEYAPTGLKKPTYTPIKLITDIVPKVEVNANDFDRMIALYQEIVAHNQKTIAQLEKTKSRLWEH